VIEDAPEPSNILWENLEVSKATRAKRSLIAGLLIALFIFITFIIFSLMKSASGANSLKYPPKTDCHSMGKLFGTSQSGIDQYK